jgi:hypothetical protein
VNCHESLEKVENGGVHFVGLQASREWDLELAPAVASQVSLSRAAMILSPSSTLYPIFNLKSQTPKRFQKVQINMNTKKDKDNTMLRETFRKFSIQVLMCDLVV